MAPNPKVPPTRSLISFCCQEQQDLETQLAKPQAKGLCLKTKDLGL